MPAHLLLALLLTIAPAGQSPRPGTRTPSPPPAPKSADADQSTGTITGHVHAADTGAPLRHASVHVINRGQRGWAQAGTDDQGRFVLADLPPGRYMLAASKGGYVSMEYGQTRPLEPGRPVDLAAGQTLEHIDVTLLRGGVITGRVLDDVGEPVVDAFVSPMRSRFINGRRRLVASGRGTRTDDRGQYRIYGLEPGQYMVQAVWHDSDAGDSGDAISYAPSYYPGTADPGAASRLTVQAGQETASVDFALTAVPVATVSGAAVDSTGQPLRNGRIVLRETLQTASAVVVTSARTSRTKPDGTFEMVGVLPGSYTLVAYGTGFQQGEQGEAPLSVGGQIVDGVRVVTSRGATLTGLVTVDADRPPRFDPRTLRVQAIPEIADDDPAARNTVARVDDKWHFSLGGLSDRAYIRIANLPPGWTLEAVHLGDTDTSDAPIDFTGRDAISGVQLTITDRLSDLSGSVLDGDGHPLTEYVLVIFPEDVALRQYPSRYIKAARPDGNGRFEVKGLPGGSYLAAAVGSLDEGEEQDPDLLEQLAKNATTFSLAQGESKSLTLSVQNASPRQ